MDLAICANHSIHLKISGAEGRGGRLARKFEIAGRSARKRGFDITRRIARGRGRTCECHLEGTAATHWGIGAAVVGETERESAARHGIAERERERERGKDLH